MGAAISAPLSMPRIARAATRKLRLGHNNTLTSATHGAALAIQKVIAEQSDGRYVLEIFPSAQLGDENQTVKAVSEGTLDAVVVGTSTLGAFHADLTLVELPYLFKDVVSARKSYDGALGAYLSELLAKASIVTLGWGENGVRHMTANKPIRKPEDLKDLKLRVQPSKLQIAAFQGLGAAAESLPFSQLAEALRTGRFDAQENPISVVVTNEYLTKLQTHISLTGHIYSPFVVLFSADAFEEMTPADRTVMKAAGAAAVKATRDFNDGVEASGLASLKAAGMTIVADVDRQAFQTAIAGLTDKLAAVTSPDGIARIRGLVV
jgi:tripartite ATP-independent transporter DctP family solute receptor